MHWLLDLTILWFGLSVTIVATAWYAATVISKFWPQWWRQVVVDTEPDNHLVSR